MPRWLFAMAGLLCLAMPIGQARAGAPEDVALTEAEQASYDDGDMVVRVEDTDQGARTTAILAIDAPPDAVLTAVLDFAPRVDEVGPVKGVAIYDLAPPAGTETIGVQWHLTVVGRSVTFHTIYEVDRAEGWCTWTLDSEKENDLSYSAGSYRAWQAGTGSRLVYVSTADAGAGVPLWLRKWLTSGSLKDQMQGIKARAEQSRSGSAL